MLILTLFPALTMAATYNLSIAEFTNINTDSSFTHDQYALSNVHDLNIKEPQHYRCFHIDTSVELINAHKHQNQNQGASLNVQCGVAAFVIAALSLNLFISYKSLKCSTALLNQMKMGKKPELISTQSLITDFTHVDITSEVNKS